MTPTPRIQAWIYPGPPACGAATDLTDGRAIDTVKAQYFTLTDVGALVQVPASQCNGYSTANVALLKAHSKQQFVTISGSIAGITSLASDPAMAGLRATMLSSFLHATQMNGIELDIEGYSSWSPEQYRAYKNVIATLGTALHAHGFQLMVDGPSIVDAAYQGYYPWKYEDFNSLPVDYLVSMCYDLHYDNGAGTPVASLNDITGCCNWMLSKVSDHNKIVIGLNSYGYHGTPGTYTNMPNDTYEQSSQYPGFANATRDAASGEMMWHNGTTFYDYSDAATLDLKLKTVLATGLSTVSVWHLGGNKWFSQGAPVQSTPLTPLPSDAALSAIREAYPGLAGWYAAHFDSQGNYHE